MLTTANFITTTEGKACPKLRSQVDWSIRKPYDDAIRGKLIKGSAVRDEWHQTIIATCQPAKHLSTPLSVALLSI